MLKFAEIGARRRRGKFHGPILALSVLLATFVLDAPAAQTQDVARQWMAVPSPEDMTAVYPRRAMAERLGGRAVIHCAVEQLGTVKDCTVQSEEPVGFGFGPAAVALAPRFRMDPRPPIARGADVLIPIRFTPFEPEITTRGLVFKPSRGRFKNLAPVGGYFPEIALRMGRGGTAVIDCRVAAAGRLTDCSLVSESPPGLNFGAAALRMVAAGWATAAPLERGDPSPQDEVFRFEIVFPKKSLRDGG